MDSVIIALTILSARYLFIGLSAKKAVRIVKILLNIAQVDVSLFMVTMPHSIIAKLMMTLYVIHLAIHVFKIILILTVLHVHLHIFPFGIIAQNLFNSVVKVHALLIKVLVL